MKTLKYTVIKTREQSLEYCNRLEELVFEETSVATDEIELLELLIGTWDRAHDTLAEPDPVTLIKSLMQDHGLKAKDMTDILGLSKSTVSKILNYHKGLSKETIRRLSDRFKVSQEAFNRPYPLVNGVNRHFRDARLMNTTKNLGNSEGPRSFA